jgi:unsaturated rhamnogalacturonyl hydrolase
MDEATSRIVPSQQIDGTLLIQTNLVAQETRRYLLLPRSAVPAVPKVEPRAHARLVPERLDDFAWENDRTAHRVYGPAILRDPSEHLVGSGVDVWSKRTRKLVLDAWYAARDYHSDHGEGLDFYQVGQSRGCGGLGVFDGRTLHPSAVFSGSSVVADGPLRAVFDLTYGSWGAAGRKVSETRRVSIDAGSNFSRVESRFSFKGRPLDVGVGIAQRAAGGHYAEHPHWISYWEPEQGSDGSVACAIVLPGARHANVNGHYLALGRAVSGTPLVYYLGAGWSKSGDFPDAQAWQLHVRDFAIARSRPLQVSVEAAPR